MILSLSGADFLKLVTLAVVPDETGTAFALVLRGNGGLPSLRIEGLMRADLRRLRDEINEYLPA